MRSFLPTAPALSPPPTSRLARAALAATGLALTGCQSLTVPAATVAQVAHPEWTWRKEEPRRLVRGEATFQIPDCAFSDPELEEEFARVIDQLRAIGAELPRVLERGEISAEEYVGYCMYIELIATSLVEICLTGGIPTDTAPSPDAARITALTRVPVTQIVRPSSPSEASAAIQGIRARWQGGRR